MVDLPAHARVVIVGGGIVGCSVAYHLAQRGCSDVVLLERRQLTCGTTWHAAGLVGQLRATRNLTRLAQYTTDLFATLEAETEQATGFLQRGSVAVATNHERFEDLKRSASMAGAVRTTSPTAEKRSTSTLSGGFTRLQPADARVRANGSCGAGPGRCPPARAGRGCRRARRRR